MINRIGNSDGAASVQGGQRPDASQLVSRLFAKLDAAGKGSIDKATLETAFSKLYAPASAAGNAVNAGISDGGGASADAMFKALDGNGDGKLTAQEATDAISNILKQIETAGAQSASGASGASGANGAGGHHHHHHHHAHGVQGAATSAPGNAVTASTSDAAPASREILHKVAQLARAYADPTGTVSTGLSLLA